LAENFPPRPGSNTMLRSSVLRIICGSRLLTCSPRGWCRYSKAE
jgi:hypothetical protein